MMFVRRRAPARRLRGVTVDDCRAIRKALDDVDWTHAPDYEGSPAWMKRTLLLACDEIERLHQTVQESKDSERQRARCVLDYERDAALYTQGV